MMGDATQLSDSSSKAGRPRARSLWLHRDFRYYWTGQSISALGTSIGGVALPLVAALTMNLDAWAVGVLASLSRLPSVILSPFIGHIVDRSNPRRLMMKIDTFRALLTAVIPIGAAFNFLSFPLLIAVSVGLSALGPLYLVAEQTFLPGIIDSGQLLDGNAKVEASQATMEIVGPGIAGWIISLSSIATAVAFDAGSFALAVLALTQIRRPSKVVAPTAVLPLPTEAFWPSVKAGFQFLWHDKALRSVSISHGMIVVFSQMQVAVYALFLVRTVGFGPSDIGFVFTLTGIASLASATASTRLARRVGVGALVVGSQVLFVLAGVLTALIGGSKIQAAALMLLAEVCWAMSGTFFGVGNRTLLQLRTPEELRGRVIGASRVFATTVPLVSGLLAGAIGTLVSLRAALLVAAGGMVLCLPLILSRDVLSVHGQTEG